MDLNDLAKLLYAGMQNDGASNLDAVVNEILLSGRYGQPTADDIVMRVALDIRVHRTSDGWRVVETPEALKRMRELREEEEQQQEMKAGDNNNDNG